MVSIDFAGAAPKQQDKADPSISSDKGGFDFGELHRVDSARKAYKVAQLGAKAARAGGHLFVRVSAELARKNESSKTYRSFVRVID